MNIKCFAQIILAFPVTSYNVLSVLISLHFTLSFVNAFIVSTRIIKLHLFICNSSIHKV